MPVIYPIQINPFQPPTVGLVHAEWIGLSPDGKDLAAAAHGICGDNCRQEAVAVMSVDAFAARVFNDTAMFFHAKGDYQRSKELLLKAYHASPEDPLFAYNLACALALLGDGDADAALRRALVLDPKALAHTTTDHDFDRVRAEPWFVSLTATSPVKDASTKDGAPGR